MKTKPTWSTRKTRIDKNKIKKLRKRGFSYREISEKLDCSLSYVADLFNKERQERRKKWLREYHRDKRKTDPSFRIKQNKASSKWIMERYRNCEAFRDNLLEYGHKRYLRNKQKKEELRLSKQRDLHQVPEV